MMVQSWSERHRVDVPPCAGWRQRLREEEPPTWEDVENAEGRLWAFAEENLRLRAAVEEALEGRTLHAARRPLLRAMGKPPDVQ